MMSLIDIGDMGADAVEEWRSCEMAMTTPS